MIVTVVIFVDKMLAKSQLFSPSLLHHLCWHVDITAAKTIINDVVCISPRIGAKAYFGLDMHHHFCWHMDMDYHLRYPPLSNKNIRLLNIGRRLNITEFLSAVITWPPMEGAWLQKTAATCFTGTIRAQIMGQLGNANQTPVYFDMPMA